MIIICIYLPYTLYINVLVLGWEWGTYDWNSVHSPQFTSIVKVPAYGKVSFERWMYVCTGYVIFFVFGTGTDAHSLYKKMLLGIGLGKVFPSLYRTSNGGSNTQHSFIKSWGSSLSTKAKSMFFSKSLDTMTSTVDDSTRNNSVVLDSIPRLKHVTSEERVLVSRQQQTLPNTKRTIFARFFSRKQNNNNGDFVLPLFSRNTDGEVTSADKSAARSSLSGVHAHVWASETSAVGRLSEADGVQIVKEFSQNSSSKEDGDLEKETAAVWT
jgi:pheromone a factor receptor